MATMKEHSDKIRSAGMEEPTREGGRKPKSPATAQPPEDDKEKPNGLESDEPPNPDKQGPPTDEVTEPPEPTEKTPEEMSKPPEAFLDPEDAERIGGDPEKSEQFAAERDASAGPEAEGVDQQMVDDMGAEKGLTDHLTEAFRDFLEPGQKEEKPQQKQKTMKEQSNAIKKAGYEQEGEEESEDEEREALGRSKPPAYRGSP